MANFWDAISQGTLRIVRCVHCGSAHHFAPETCPTCWSTELDWLDASGEGTVASCTTVSRAPSSALRERVPYHLALVDLSEGPRVMAWLSEPCSPGTKVRASTTAGPDRTLLIFEAAQGTP
jgi:uncharacterized OB-fold protein